LIVEGNIEYTKTSADANPTQKNLWAEERQKAEVACAAAASNLAR